MSERTARAAAGLAAAAIALTATAVAVADGGGQPAPTRGPAPLTVTTGASGDAVLPGRAVTGTVQLTNAGPTPRQVTEVVLAAPRSDACDRTGLVLAPTVPPTPEAPLEVPAGGTATLGWTAYMDGSTEHACQGATFTSAVTLDGVDAGTLTVTAGVLEPPAAPTGGLTTSTRAAVRWSASTAADPGWVLERAVVGTDDWQPACGSSAPRPLRTPSCTDTGLSKRTSYAYRVTLRTGHWHMTSRPSGPVTTQQRPST